MILINIFLILVWLVVIPYLIGILVTNILKTKESISCIYVIGMLSVFAVFECLAIPMTFLHASLSVLVNCFASVMGITSLVTSIACRSRLRSTCQCLAHQILDYRVSFWGVLALSLIVGQTVIAAFMDIPNYNIDDAWYLGVATTAVDTNTIMEYDAYTGEAYGGWPMRYVLSPFPIFEAVISRLVGLHPVVLAHVVLPLVFIPVSYMIYRNIGKRLFSKKKESVYIFLTILSLLNIFANYSWFTPGTFLLVRIWQGKAMLANIVLPLIYYLCMKAVVEKGHNGYWGLLFITALSSVMLSSMGVYLSPFLLGVIVLVYAVRYKKISILVKGMLCCVPCVLTGIVYLVMG